VDKDKAYLNCAHTVRTIEEIATKIFPVNRKQLNC